MLLLDISIHKISKENSHVDFFLPVGGDLEVNMFPAFKKRLDEGLSFVSKSSPFFMDAD